MGCDYFRLKGYKKDNNQKHYMILDWILFPKTLFKAPKRSYLRQLGEFKSGLSIGWHEIIANFLIIHNKYAANCPYIYIYLTALDEGRDWVCLYFTAAFSEAS